MIAYRVRFVSCLATEADEEWITSPSLSKGGVVAWITSKSKELGKTAIETQPA